MLAHISCSLYNPRTHISEPLKRGKGPHQGTMKLPLALECTERIIGGDPEALSPMRPSPADSGPSHRKPDGWAWGLGVWGLRFRFSGCQTQGFPEVQTKGRLLS